ncbi:MAG: branched chain amino acid aminotransferase, partial [Oscillospiraceae bacterium]|nr:branched chain amino acid aminotransferase [Oscillospiraceae bacterium]
CLEVLRKEGYKVSERLLSIDELEEAMENGTLKEAWGCGTAAVISPIGSMGWEDKKAVINEGKIGPTAQKLYDTLYGIQSGNVEDTLGWTFKVCD